MFSLFGFVIVRKSKFDKLASISACKSKLDDEMAQYLLNGCKKEQDIIRSVIPENNQDLFTQQPKLSLRNEVIVASFYRNGKNVVISETGCTNLCSSLKNHGISIDQSHMSKYLKIHN